MIWIDRGNLSEIEGATEPGRATTEIAGTSHTHECAPRAIMYDSVHSMLGHTGTAETLKSAEYLGYDVTDAGDTRDPCEPCAHAKARQKKNILKITQREIKDNAELLYLDLCSIKGTKEGPKVNALGHWRMMVDGRMANLLQGSLDTAIMIA